VRQQLEGAFFRQPWCHDAADDRERAADDRELRRGQRLRRVLTGTHRY